MSDRIVDVDARSQPFEAAIVRRLEAIERRLDRLESEKLAWAGRAAGSSHEAPQPDDGMARRGSGVPDVAGIVTLFGRTLVVLAGAFLLRALTDSGRLDAGPGILLGLTFAATWIVMAGRRGGRGHDASAVFHGVAFVLIAFPLLFEATTRFHFLNAATAAAGLAACTAVALAASWRGRLHGLAWVATLGGLSTAVMLAVATGELGPFALFLVLLGVATLWLGYVLDWTLLRWPVAFVADVAIWLLAARAVVPHSTDTPAMALGAEIVLLVAYLGSFATRTLLLNRNVVPFEVAQSIVGIIVGLGGAAYLTRMTGSGTLPLAITTLALAIGCYGAAAIFVERRQSRRRNYYFYTSAGLVFALVGGAMALPSAAAGPVYAVLGVIAASLGRLSNRVTYRAHGAAYLTAAVVVTGLFPHVLYGLGVPAPPDGALSASMVGVVALCGMAMWGLGLPDAAVAAVSPMHRAPRLIVVILVLGGMLGAAASWMLPPPTSAHALGPGLVATVRTGLLVAGILALALASRVWDVVEGAWLVYPLLVLTGLKFVLEDVRAGHPATLFIGFALYGLALLVGPRLCRRPADAAVSSRREGQP